MATSESADDVLAINPTRSLIEWVQCCHWLAVLRDNNLLALCNTARSPRVLFRNTREAISVMRQSSHICDRLVYELKAFIEAALESNSSRCPWRMKSENEENWCLRIVEKSCHNGKKLDTSLEFANRLSD